MNAVSQALIEHDDAQPPRRLDLTTSAPPVVHSPMDLVFHAVQSGQSVEVIKEVMALTREMKREQAREAFDEAMAAAKAEIPVISKNRKVGYEHKSGGGETNYRHEDLGEIARTVDPILSKHGLSYRFKTTSEPNQPVSVTCIVSHRLGHYEENTLVAGRDDSGKKNSIQAIGSTITYLQRYTLKAALGLAASADDDGGKADETTEDGPIADDQVKTLWGLIEETGTDTAAFCKYFRIGAVTELPMSQFDRAIKSLEKKKAAH